MNENLVHQAAVQKEDVEEENDTTIGKKEESITKKVVHLHPAAVMREEKLGGTLEDLRGTWEELKKILEDFSSTSLEEGVTKVNNLIKFNKCE